MFYYRRANRLVSCSSPSLERRHKLINLHKVLTSYNDSHIISIYRSHLMRTRLYPAVTAHIILSRLRNKNLLPSRAHQRQVEFCYLSTGLRHIMEDRRLTERELELFGPDPCTILLWKSKASPAARVVCSAVIPLGSELPDD